MDDDQLAAIRARLSDEWPTHDGIECRPGVLGGYPVLSGTRWPVRLWYGSYRDHDNADRADHAVRVGWPEFTPEQIATARAYVLAHLALFDARARLDTTDPDALETLYREDCAALLARVAALEAALLRCTPALVSWDDYDAGGLWCNACERPIASEKPDDCPHGHGCPLVLIASSPHNPSAVFAGERASGPTAPTVRAKE